MFEVNATGDRITSEDAEDQFGFWEMLSAYYGASDKLTLVVTKAELLENSLVTIGSNHNAFAMQNALGSHYEAKAREYEERNKYKIELEKLKKNDINQEEETPETKEVIEEEKPEVSTVENTDGENPDTEGQTSDTGESPEVTAPENEAQTNELEALKNDFEEFKKDCLESFKGFIDHHNSIVDAYNSLRDEVSKTTNAVSSIRVSKGLPYVKPQETKKEDNMIHKIIKTLK